MAERWQQWMPFHIDRFRGSPNVQAMHPAARCGFLYLLSSAWQTADCSISADPLDLATESGLGDELWAIHGPRILRMFHDNGNGRLVNDVLTGEWNLAYRKFLANQERAKNTNDKRRANAERTSDVRQDNVKRTHLQEQEYVNTPQTPQGGPKVSKREAKRLATASLGMVPVSEKSSDALIDYYRLKRNKGSPEYAKDCPQWVKEILEKET